MYQLRLLAAVALLAGCSVLPESSYYDPRMATLVLTQPDGGPGGYTTRWAGPRVTYRLDIDDYPADYQQLVRDVMAWASLATSLEVVEVDGPAQIVVVPREGNGAHVTVWGQAGEFQHGVVELGCCRPRAIWEDGLQAFGPMGDRADSRSLFSQDITGQQTPSRFDLWLLRVLYELAPRTGEIEVMAYLAATPEGGS